MIDRGIVVFLNKKSVNIHDGIQAYYKYKEKKLNFRYSGNINKFIGNNWVNFATFIDKSIKDGSLKGKAVRLDYYHEEQREYKRKVKEEFERENLTPLEKKLVDKVRKIGIGFISSFLMKNGFGTFGKDTSFHSKTLQWLPLIRYAIKNGIEEHLNTQEQNETSR